MKSSEHYAIKQKRHAIVAEIDAALILVPTDPGNALDAALRAALALRWVASRIVGELLRRSKAHRG